MVDSETATLLGLSLEATQLCFHGIRKLKPQQSTETSTSFWSQQQSPSLTYMCFAETFGQPFSQGRDDVYKNLSKINAALRHVVDRADVQTEDVTRFQQLVQGFIRGLQLFAREVGDIEDKSTLQIDSHHLRDFEKFLLKAAKQGHLGYCSGALALQNTALSSFGFLETNFYAENGECKRCGSTIAELSQRESLHLQSPPHTQHDNTLFYNLQWELAKSHIVARSVGSSAAAFMCRQCHKYGHYACFATAIGLVAHITGNILHPPIEPNIDDGKDDYGWNDFNAESLYHGDINEKLFNDALAIAESVLG